MSKSQIPVEAFPMLTNLLKELLKDATVVPVICASNTKPLTNTSGNEKAWPIYLTIRNNRSTTRNMLTVRTLIVLALMLCLQGWKVARA
jgi:hypothetical protein